MRRLGELLVADGILTEDQVQTALRAQVMWGGRLGTNLVELGFLDVDALSSALGRQHGRPAALARHFEKVDPALQRMLTPDFAERFACVPVCRTTSGDGSIVLAVTQPIDARATAIVADELAVTPAQVIQALAGELRIRYHLEVAYGIPRGARFLRSRGPAVPAFAYDEAPSVPESTPELAIPDDLEYAGLTMPVDMRVTVPIHTPLLRAPAHAPEPDLDDIPELDAELIPDLDVELAADPVAGAPAAAVAEPAATPAVAPATAPDASPQRGAPGDDAAIPVPIPAVDSGRERRRYVRTLADMVDAGVPTGLDPKTLGRIALRRVAVGGKPPPPSALAPTGDADDAAPTTSFAEATRAIRRAGDRDRVAELAMETIDRFAPTCRAAMALVVRGEVAIGWKGFIRGDAPPPEFGVPLEEQSLVLVARKNQTARGAAADLSRIDQLLLAALGQQDGDLVVVPIAIGGHVGSMIAVATASDAPVAAVEAIAASAGTALARLMRDAGR